MKLLCPLVSQNSVLCIVHHKIFFFFLSVETDEQLETEHFYDDVNDVVPNVKMSTPLWSERFTEVSLSRMNPRALALSSQESFHFSSFMSPKILICSHCITGFTFEALLLIEAK